MGFLEWNKKMLNDNRPLAGFNFRNDGKGNEQFKMFILGSYFWYDKRAPSIEEPRVIEPDELVEAEIRRIDSGYSKRLDKKKVLELE